MLRCLNGEIWAADGSGLCKYNGSTWEAFTTSNSGIPSDYVLDVATGSDSVIWIATDAGVGKLYNSIWTIYDTTNTPFTTTNISAIDVDENNHVWVATLDNNLAGSAAAEIFMFDGINWNTFPTAVYPGDQINVIHCVTNDNVSH